MANKMLIDATHPEETRVVVVRGNRVEEFDFESANRRQLRGNIYLAKVTRVEPSLQAAFVDYGGNRHVFLAFGEIHPDYYQIPVADRQALIDEEERAHRAADAEVERRSSNKRRRDRRPHRARRDEIKSEPIAPIDEDLLASPVESALAVGEAPGAEEMPVEVAAQAETTAEAAVAEAVAAEAAPLAPEEAPADVAPQPAEARAELPVAETAEVASTETEAAEGDDEDDEEDEDEGGHDGDTTRREAKRGGDDHDDEDDDEEEEIVESVGGADALEEVPDRMLRQRRQYKIQEVIKRRQIMLVQVVKEERGTKGAALTTYLSLAGRYSVLMPNTARGGGISRKITSALDRKRLKEIATDLEVPEGMGVILRTAGANRTKTEVKRDFEYLLRLWETVRDLTLKSSAPSLVYEEGSLIKRSIRDLYNKDIDEVLVGGDDGYREAKDFMRMLMPSHAKNVKPYKEPQPVFTRFGVESQLDAMFSPTVQLKSGGYIVLNQTEALVAIDVNSGRSTREHHIEDTALKTNTEAAEEVARQLRLRDLAGLIVIDFIDMDEKRNNRSVERKLKESLKNDRARIQVGRISHFGLLEMSRQRIRTSVFESSTEKCPHCGGTGHLRSVSSVALQLVRAVEELLLKGATHNLIVRTRADVAIYVLNHKRAHLRDLEQRFRVTITVNADATLVSTQPFAIDKGEQVHTLEAAKALVVQPTSVLPLDEDEEDEEEIAEGEGEAEAEAEDEAEDEATEAAGEGRRPRGPQAERGEGDADGRRRRRRRRRGRRGEGREEGGLTGETVAEHTVAHGEDFEPGAEGDEAEDGEEAVAHAEGTAEERAEAERRRRRRGRRGGRRGRGERGEREPGGTAEAIEAEADASAESHVHAAVADLDDVTATPAAERQPAPAVAAPPPPAAGINGDMSLTRRSFLALSASFPL